MSGPDFNPAQVDGARRSGQFPLGRLMATPAALQRLAEQTEHNSQSLLLRHWRGDWGEVCAEDAGLNDQALVDGGRLLSVYHLSSGTVWIITEADRSCTTLLNPGDY